ncbi:MAG TPA: TonB family protein [Candidatus Methylacidiphilales bacterium]|nr:TonB family protein [Candidatus Methylacidiphilales bacterium]
MIASTDRQRELVGWSVSILFHAALLIFGAALLIQPARFHVEPGRTSTEIEFAIAPAPEVTPAPPMPVPVPSPPVQPAPAPEPVKVVIAPTPKPVAIPPPPTPLVSAKPQPPRPPAPPKASPVKEETSASKGAIQAQPDELHNEPPEYPDESRLAHEQGTVILQVEVTAAGEPANVSILQSSGYFRLDQAARRAVQHWKFHPAMTAGIPVSSEADVPVHFKLQ